MQKVVGNNNFKVFAFIKVDEKDANKSFVDGLQNMTKLLTKQSLIERERIVVPVCSELGDIAKPYQCMVVMSEVVRGIKRIQFNTVSTDCFESCIASWLSFYRKVKKIVSIE